MVKYIIEKKHNARQEIGYIYCPNQSHPTFSIVKDMINATKFNSYREACGFLAKIADCCWENCNYTIKLYLEKGFDKVELEKTTVELEKGMVKLEKKMEKIEELLATLESRLARATLKTKFMPESSDPATIIEKITKLNVYKETHNDD